MNYGNDKSLKEETHKNPLKNYWQPILELNIKEDEDSEHIKI